MRFEDIDPAASIATKRRDLADDVTWFGLDWDATLFQSELRADHEAALDRLADLNRLYECDCTRSKVQKFGWPSASGGWIYPGTCRYRRVRDWRACRENLRCDLGDGEVFVADEGGKDLSQNVASTMGDPIVRRGDGTFSYQLAVVADDAAAGVDRVVRGRDIETSTATQAALYDLLGYRRPVWRHHLLLLEPKGGKLAKLHRSVGADLLRNVYRPEQMISVLARVAGLVPGEEPAEGRPICFDPGAIDSVRSETLAVDFSWDKVRKHDQVLDWDGQRLIWRVSSETLH